MVGGKSGNSNTQCQTREDGSGRAVPARMSDIDAAAGSSRLTRPIGLWQCAVGRQLERKGSRNNHDRGKKRQTAKEAKEASSWRRMSGQIAILPQEDAFMQRRRDRLRSDDSRCLFPLFSLLSFSPTAHCVRWPLPSALLPPPSVCALFSDREADDQSWRLECEGDTGKREKDRIKKQKRKRGKKKEEREYHKIRQKARRSRSHLSCGLPTNRSLSPIQRCRSALDQGARRVGETLP